MNPTPSTDRRASARRRDHVAGILILAVAFLTSLSVAWWAKVESAPEVSVPPAPPSTSGLAGFPDRVEPIAHLDLAQRLTRRRLLRSIVADGVNAEGTVDVGGKGRIRYTFQSAAGEGAQPPRDPDTLARRHYCGKQAVEIGPRGIAAEPDQVLVSCPGAAIEPLPTPKCGPREVWEKVRAMGRAMPERARIEYYQARVGPAWRFVPAGGAPAGRLALDASCDRVLADDEAVARYH